MKTKSKNRIPRMKRLLWEATRKYIYAKYLRNGKWYCYTCGRECEGANRHAGHFIPDSICPPSLRYDERNLRIQCYNCNVNLGGWGERYAEKLIEEVGIEEVTELRKIQKQKQGEKWEVSDYQAKIDFYDTKRKALDKKYNRSIIGLHK
jgi:hypothetical protein